MSLTRFVFQFISVMVLIFSLAIAGTAATPAAIGKAPATKCLVTGDTITHASAGLVDGESESSEEPTLPGFPMEEAHGDQNETGSVKELLARGQDTGPALDFNLNTFPDHDLLCLTSLSSAPELRPPWQV